MAKRRMGLMTKSSHGEMVRPALQARDLGYGFVQLGTPDVVKVAPDYACFVQGAEAWRDTFVSFCRTHDVAFVFANGHQDDLVLEESELGERIRALGIPYLGHAPRCARICFDKWLTREVAFSQGVACTPGRLVQSTDDVRALLAETGAPVFLKRRAGWAGLANQIVRSEEELRGITLNSGESALAEGFVDGLEIGVTVLRHAGRCWHFPAALKGTTRADNTHALEKIRLIHRNIPAPLAKEVERSCERIAHALEADGWLDFEFILSEAGLQLIEINARISGMSRLTAYAIDGNLYDLGMGLLLGEGLDAKRLEACHLAVEVPLAGRLSGDLSAFDAHMTYTRKPFSKPTRITVAGMDEEHLGRKLRGIEAQLGITGILECVHREAEAQLALTERYAKGFGK